MNGPQNLSDDLKELIELLSSHHVQFLIVGGHAVAVRGFNRYTEDLGVFVRREKENIDRFVQAMQEYGFDFGESAKSELLSNPRAMIVLGRAPHRVDILNFLDGLDFEEAWGRREHFPMSGIEKAPFISLPDLIRTKKASGRTKDLLDLVRLQEILGDQYPSDEISNDKPDR